VSYICLLLLCVRALLYLDWIANWASFPPFGQPATAQARQYPACQEHQSVFSVKNNNWQNFAKIMACAIVHACLDNAFCDNGSNLLNMQTWSPELVDESSWWL
jgi:hypothetical protein